LVDRVEIKDTSGAGDTFLAGLVYEYMASGDIHKAMEFANRCATKVVQMKGVNVI
jgi:sugar/nucleoside kinase (ribokinase family)